MIWKKPEFFYYSKNNIYFKIFAYSLMWPFMCLYLLIFTTVMHIKNKNKIKLKQKTICIGNIVIGGSGKTPSSMEIGQFLKEKYQLKVCYISKGYGRTSNIEIGIPTNNIDLFDYKETGDESILLSQISDVCVVNSRNNYKFDLSNYDVLIYDDGLYDNSFHKDANIAIFDMNFFIGNGLVLPCGPLRLTLKHSFRNIDYVICTDFNENRDSEKIKFLSKYISPDKIIKATLQITNLNSFDLNKNYLAFAGIGENKKFFNTLKMNNFSISRTINFSDHHNYTIENINEIIAMAISSNLSIITTKKDWIKIPKELKEKIQYLDIKFKLNNYDFLYNIVSSIESLK